MSSNSENDLQSAVLVLLTTPYVRNGQTVKPTRAPVEIVKRVTKSLANDIAAAAANHGLCMFVMPPLPLSVLQDVPFVSVDKNEIRVRIIEQPAVNEKGASAYDIMDDVMTTLHWRPTEEEAADPANTNPLKKIVAYPLTLAPRPVEFVEDPTYRMIDVIFHAVHQLNPQ